MDHLLTYSIKTYIYIHTYTYTYTCIYIYTHIYMCVCIHCWVSSRSMLLESLLFPHDAANLSTSPKPLKVGLQRAQMVHVDFLFYLFFVGVFVILLLLLVFLWLVLSW